MPRPRAREPLNRLRVGLDVLRPGLGTMRAGSYSKPSRSHTGTSFFVKYSISRRGLISSGATNVNARPSCPARPVRPMRCT